MVSSTDKLSKSLKLIRNRNVRTMEKVEAGAVNPATGTVISLSAFISFQDLVRLERKQTE
jgi:hypothetical protein